MTKAPPKAPEAFRTIGEVAELLETPAHVLRFWESRFPQVKPVKRAGGRRYYRPDDVALLGGIKALLQDQGMTIKGVQRMLSEQGARHVAGLAPALIDPESPEIIEDEPAPSPAPDTTADAPSPARAPLRVIRLVPETDETSATTEAPPAALPPQAPAPASEPDYAAQADTPSVAQDTSADLDAELIADNAISRDAETATNDAAPELPLHQTETPEDPPASQSVPQVTRADAPISSAQDPAAPRLPTTDPAATEPDTTDSPQNGTRPMNDLAPPLPEPVAPSPHDPAQTVRIAQRLRAQARGTLGNRREQYQMVARRLDQLLDRMSDASGAGRW